MFQCSDCHDERRHTLVFQSIGPCESCGKTRACIDCHISGCMPPKAVKKKAAKKAAKKR